ncbi:MAG: dTDP-4-dehydrorhamnose 3,5-epimerase [Solirubrobacteraceae bacterium]
MRAHPTQLSGPLLIEPPVYRDERGFFLESYRRSMMQDLGVSGELVQHNHSRSHRGVVRGMHFQPGMGKLVRCLRGTIFDVLVDIRRGSETFGHWEGFELDDSTHHELWCPDGFAHGFCVRSEVADVVYACTSYHDPATDSGFRYDDPEVAISWPDDLELIASQRDRTAPSLAEIADSLPLPAATT